MADRKRLDRSASTESTEYSVTMGRSVRDKKKKPKERWLLTRKTWRYMTDAGRKLIPDGAQNRPEDLPKIEAYFQEVCKKEPRFLLWRKNSYPGAMGLRKKRKERMTSRKSSSCRKASSADEVVDLKPERPKDLPLLTSTSGGRFDINKMKRDFLNTPTEDPEDKQLITMLEQYLKIADTNKNAPSTSYSAPNFNYQDLVDKLQRHLITAGRNYPYLPNYPQTNTDRVRFNGDHVQKSLSETLSRYFSQSTNRDKIISDLLTDRKALEKLYFDLRKTRGFRGSRGNGNYSPTTTSPAFGVHLKSTPRGGYDFRHNTQPPPLIEIESEPTPITYEDSSVQTVAINENLLKELEEQYRKNLAEKNEEEHKEAKNSGGRRRSSVDNDDVSQSVSDTIKRYLRMARKKSVDTDKVDRFKRVNYDRNLRNIKAKGEITKIGDDDGLNKGCQTNDDWITKYRDLRFDEILSDCSRLSSSRSSIDQGHDDYSSNKLVIGAVSTPSPSKTHSFLSHLLHHKHDKSIPIQSNLTNPAALASSHMQKSKSSTNVVQQGGRLMAKKIFRSRSKSQTRPNQAACCSWTPQGSCVWTNITGRQVVLDEKSLLQLSEIERKILHKVAVAKLQALNLGVAVKVPTENVNVVNKPKRRPYLLKRKAITTSIFDTNRKDNEKDSTTSGLVFGIPISQCVENDRLSRTASASSPFRSSEISATSGVDDGTGTMGRHGSRASFSSLIEAPRGDEGGSCESLMLRERIVGSVPGLLDAISCASTPDLAGIVPEEEASVPQILNACFRHIEQHGLHTLGIFRVSTSKKRIRQLREDFDSGKETTLDDEQCPHDVATLLKEYLRELPDPLLCRDLYQAFVQTQRIRNRRLQFEALQHLVQLLPPANRDTLHALLCFLATVARHSEDSKMGSGNKMDSNNLATVFAPNILHCVKSGGKESSSSSSSASTERPEDRIDVINVVRTLIDHYQELFKISPELLDEIYVHMMDTHPEALDQLLNKCDAIAGADESVEELDSESSSAPWTPTALETPVEIPGVADTALGEPKKMYSREEFLHEAAATGGPNLGMRLRHKDRIRERSTRRKREESASRKKKDEDSGSIGSGITSAINIITRLRGQKDDDYQYGKNRSSSLESTSSAYTDDAGRLQPDRRQSSPYVLDGNGVIKASLTIPVQPLNTDEDIPYIEDADNTRSVLKSTPQAPPRRRQRSVSGSDSSVASNIQPITGSISLVQSYDSAVGSSATTVQNTPTDPGGMSSPPSWASTPPTSPDSTHTSVNYIPEDGRAILKVQKINSPTLQKVSFSNLQPIRKTVQKTEITKTKTVVEQSKEREPKLTPSISNIGNAVLKSKTAEFERITKVEPKIKTTTTTLEKKKYTKRRYTDSRHQTRHIPDAEALETASAKKEEKPSTTPQAGPVYKRRELISSVPTK